MMNKTAERKELIKNLSNYISKKRLDRYATDKQKVLKHIEKNENEVDIMLFCAHFESIYGRDRMDELNENHEVYLRPMLDRLSTMETNEKMLVDVQAARLFIYTTLARRCGVLTAEQVIANLENVLALCSKLKYEHQWSAFANYEMAEMLFKQPQRNLDQVARYLETALNTKSYGLEEAFQTRIKLAIQQNALAKTREQIEQST
jgi:hypothetical protein